MVLDFVREKIKPRYKLLYKIFEKQHGYYPFLGISPFPTSIKLEDFIDGIQIFFIVFVKWFFDIIFRFVLTLTCYNLDYF